MIIIDIVKNLMSLISDIIQNWFYFFYEHFFQSYNYKSKYYKL